MNSPPDLDSWYEWGCWVICPSFLLMSGMKRDVVDYHFQGMVAGESDDDKVEGWE
jgi:hypothetical protein